MLRAVLLGSKAGRVCGLLSTMAGLTKGIASWFSGRRRPKGDGFGLELPCAGGMYSRLEDISVHDEASLSGEANFLPVKQEKICSEVFELLLGDNSVNIVALSGERGIGKSTILQRLESEALKLKKFSIVLKVSLTNSGNLPEKVVDVFKHKFGDLHKDDLTTPCKPYLLLVDDLAKPDQVNDLKSLFDFDGKVVFTVELGQSTCYPTLQIMPLDAEEAWDLFHKELGAKALEISDSDMNKFAKKMVAECHGLPIALKILAGAIKGGNSLVDLMNDSATQLNDFAKLLSFALDSLPTLEVKECFLYTAMFPRGGWIKEKALFEYWFGENLIGVQSTNLIIAREECREIIEKLKEANLLEERSPCRGDLGRAVKMCDTIRYMVLCHKRELLVESDVKLEKAQCAKRWAVAKRASFMSNDIRELKLIPKSNLLETLFLNDNYNLKEIPNNFFAAFTRLKVLDLSYTGLTKLPGSIGKMRNMEYLNLSSLLIENLPEELGNLNKLKWLALERTLSLRSIPIGLLSKFVKLQAFFMVDSAFALPDLVIEDMNGLLDLTAVGIHIDFNCLDKLSEKMAQSTTSVLISHSQFEIESIELSSFKAMKSLEDLSFDSFPGLREIVIDANEKPKEAIGANEEDIMIDVNEKSEDHMFAALKTLQIFGLHKLEGFNVKNLDGDCFLNLQKVKIVDCSLLMDISWIESLPNLIDLVLIDNNKMNSLFGKPRMTDRYIPKLKFMTLSNLASLETIDDHVTFPSLEILVIFKCPKLTRLPNGFFGDNMNLRCKCNREWWSKISKGMGEDARKKIFPHFIRLMSFADE